MRKMDEPHNPMQAILDGMSAGWQKERAANGMTLGGLIALLEKESSERTVRGLGMLDSYRGYYEDLAFDPTDGARTVADLLSECRGAMGKVFTGYKGGDFLMGETTALWVSPYGNATGHRLVGLKLDKDGALMPDTRSEYDD